MVGVIGDSVTRQDGASVLDAPLLDNERRKWVVAAGAALALHVSVGLLLQEGYRRQDILPTPYFIAVEILPAPDEPKQKPERVAASTPSVAKSPPSAPTPSAPTTSAPIVTAPTTIAPMQNLPPPILESESGSTTGHFPAQTADESSADEGVNYVPSEWALEPALAQDNLENANRPIWAADVDCLRSLSEDCADMRKAVFKEFALTEMDKVWTAARADTGMGSEFYGLSEEAIRRKVGSKIAGQNGIMLLPGIGIDGQLWDYLHGVKKGCEMKRGIDSSGNYGVVRVCPDSLPAARDKKYHIPLKP